LRAEVIIPVCGKQPAGTILVCGRFPLLLSILHNRRKRLGIKAGSADEPAVDLALRHQRIGIFWFDAATVEDSHVVGGDLA